MRQNYQVLVIDEMPGVKEEEVSKMPARYLRLPNVLANIHLHIQSEIHIHHNRTTTTQYSAKYE